MSDLPQTESPHGVRYFVAPDKTKVGPLTEEAVRAKIVSGEYSGEMMAWKEGTPVWVHLREIFPQAASTTGTAVTLPVSVAVNTAVMGDRVIALLIDGLILAVLNAVAIAADLAVPGAPHVIVTVLYATLTLASSKQATPGMTFSKIKLITETGAPIDFKIALYRSFMALLSTLVFGFGYLWAFWDDKHQTLHDKVVGTLVVKA